MTVIQAEMIQPPPFLGSQNKRPRSIRRLSRTMGRKGTMRLKLEFHPSVKHSYPRKALFMVSEDMKTIGDLSKEVAEQFETRVVPELLGFSVGGYTAPWDSLTQGVLREGDVVVVEALPKSRFRQKREEGLPAAEDSKAAHVLNKKRKAPPAVTNPPQKHPKGNPPLVESTPLIIEGSASEDAGRALVSATPSGLQGEAKAGASVGPPVVVKQTAKHTSSSSSELSELSEESSKEDAAPAASPSAQEQEVCKPPRNEAVSSSSSEESESSEESSEKGSSSSSSSSSEESSTDSSDLDSDSQSAEGDPKKKSAVETAPKDDAPAIPQAPLFRDDWPKLRRTPVEKDVVVYKMLEVGAEWTPEVTDWRYGSVSAFDTTTRVVSLVPWPDLSVHPDPKIIAHWEALEKDAEEEDDLGKKCLDLPQSEYQDDGTLHRTIDDFLEIRLVESGAVDSNTSAPKSSDGRKTTKSGAPQEKTPNRKLTRCQKRRFSRRKQKCGGLQGGSMSANGGEKSGFDCRKDTKSVDGTPLSGSEWNDVEKMLAEKRKTIIKAAEQGTPVPRYRGSSLLGVLAHIRGN